MKVKRFFYGIPVFVIAMLMQTSSFAEEPAQVDVLKKLDELITGQKQVLAKLEEMKQELYIIKIRATKR